MNKFRTLLAKLLVCVMLIGSVIMPMTALAGNPFTTGQCTWYAYKRWTELLGYEPAVIAGNAGGWYANAPAAGFSVGSSPAVGSIACWNNGFGNDTGHVAIVESVSASGITVSEYNWNVELGYGTATINFSSINRSSSSKPNRHLVGYIYLPGGVNPNPNPNPNPDPNPNPTAAPNPTSGTYLHIDSPVATTYTGDIEIKGWVVSDKDISYAMGQVNNVSQYNLELYDSEDIYSVYTNLPYRKRFRGIIPIGHLSSNSAYEFFAWIGFADGSTANTSSVNFSTGQITPNTYTITYNANGGSGAPASQTKTQRVDMLLSPAIPTRFGYNFLGWSTDSKATAPEYVPGNPYVADASLSLYAVWKSAEVIDASLSKRDIPIDPPHIGWNATFKFTPADTTQYRFETSGEKDTWVRIKDTAGNLIASDDNSGTNNNAKLQYVLTAGTSYFIEVGLNHDYGGYGLHFTHSWPLTLDPSGGMGGGTFYKYFGGSLKFTHKPTLSHTVTLDPNGGTVSSDTLSVNAELLGWSRAAGSSEIAYAVGSTYSADKALTVYAVWGSPKLGEVETPVREGYAFDGWMTADGSMATADMTVSTDLTLTARWTKLATDEWKDVSLTEAINIGEGRVYLEWIPGGEADSYRVYERIDDSLYLIAEVSEPACTLEYVEPGMHEYCVRPMKAGEKGNDSASVSVDASPLAVTVYLTGDSRMAKRPLPAAFDTAIEQGAEWASSNLSVAIASGSSVTGRKAGKAVISAICEKYTMKCAVSVVEPAVMNIPAHVTVIPEQAFLNDTAIEAVMIGSGATAISAEAFAGCTGMQVILIPDSVSDIAPSAFEGLDGLTICCTEGSAAWLFAAANGFECFPIS